MYKKDQIKGIIAIILFSIIGIVYFFSDDSSLLTTVSILAFIIWLVTMITINRRYK